MTTPPEQLQAAIGDRQVTVLALRVDGKKLPLQLFRQVPRADCLTAEHQFDEGLKPWGRVVYKIPKEGEQWLLAARDGQLVRCCLDLPSLSTHLVEHHIRGAREKLSIDKVRHAELLKLHSLPQLFLT